MPMNTRDVEDVKVVEIVLAGLLTDRDLQELVGVPVALGREKGATLYLCDCSQVEVADSIATLYSLIELYDAIRIDRRWKQAVLLPAAPSTHADLDFYETAARNRGFEVRVFAERDEALGWLTEKSTG
jgi:hypothetical protein